METENIPASRSTWPIWADFLRRHGMEKWIAWVLEDAGPLTLLGSQVLYIGGPLFRPWMDEKQEHALAGLLEDREEVKAFAAYLLREGDTSS
jgi:hypothetical protein